MSEKSWCICTFSVQKCVMSFPTAQYFRMIRLEREAEKSVRRQEKDQGKLCTGMKVQEGFYVLTGWSHSVSSEDTEKKAAKFWWRAQEMQVDVRMMGHAAGKGQGGWLQGKIFLRVSIFWMKFGWVFLGGGEEPVNKEANRQNKTK